MTHGLPRVPVTPGSGKPLFFHVCRMAAIATGVKHAHERYVKDAVQEMC
jgi:hypothetical protein